MTQHWNNPGPTKPNQTNICKAHYNSTYTSKKNLEDFYPQAIPKIQPPNNQDYRVLCNIILHSFLLFILRTYFENTATGFQICIPYPRLQNATLDQNAMRLVFGQTIVIFRQFSSKNTVLLDKDYTKMTIVSRPKIVKINRTVALYRRGFGNNVK